MKNMGKADRLNTKEARIKAKKTKGENTGVIFEIDGYTVRTDPYCYHLLFKGETVGFYPDMLSIVEEMLERKSKYLMLKSTRKSLKDIKDAINEARDWMQKKVKPLLKN